MDGEDLVVRIEPPGSSEPADRRPRTPGRSEVRVHREEAGSSRLVKPSGLTEIIATFGDPWAYATNKAAWESKILAIRTLPAHLEYAYAPLDIRKIRAHKLIVDELVAALMECFEAGVPRSRMKYGGCYTWRSQRGSSKLSTHTWGIAVDLDPAENPLGKRWINDGKMLDPRIIGIFQDRGWKWGGEFSRPDAQHFQLAVNY